MLLVEWHYIHKSMELSKKKKSIIVEIKEQQSVCLLESLKCVRLYISYVFWSIFTIKQPGVLWLSRQWLIEHCSFNAAKLFKQFSLPHINTLTPLHKSSGAWHIGTCARQFAWTVVSLVYREYVGKSVEEYPTKIAKNTIHGICLKYCHSEQSTGVEKQFS